jgi:hypothetical protein
MKTIQFSLLLATLMTGACVSAADGDSNAGHFAKGTKQFTVLGGTGYAFDESYIVLGAGVSYYVMDGLNLGLQLETWTSGTPGIFKITPSVNYVFYKTPTIQPYIGAFYRYTDVESRRSFDSLGGRAGVYLRMGRNAYAGLGGVYESYLDCDPRVWGSCDETYPEISFTFAF